MPARKELVRPAAVAAGGLAVAFAIVVAGLWITLPAQPGWMIETNFPWIPAFGINYHLGMDGVSLLLARRAGVTPRHFWRRIALIAALLWACDALVIDFSRR